MPEVFSAVVRGGDGRCAGGGVVEGGGAQSNGRALRHAPEGDTQEAWRRVTFFTRFSAL